MTLRGIFLIGSAALAGITASVLWIDLPLARFFAGFGLWHAVFTSAPVKLPVMTILAAVGPLVGLSFLVAGRKLPRWAEAAMLAGIAMLVSQWLTHDLLKPAFGRVVPSIYLETGRHGFYWFHGGLSYGSFPSGHSVEAAAMLAVASAYYPRGQWAYGAMMALLALALMLGQWHYLGDILAGATVGSIIAVGTMSAWRRALSGAAMFSNE